MDRKTAGYTDIFKALSDANRLQIVDMLSCGELCACRLLEHFRITQPTLSHHMKVLTDCGLVTARKDGVWTHYSINPEKAEEFQAYVRRLLSDKEDCVCKSGPAASCQPKVAFVCTHNSCRSQMAEALARLFAEDTLEPYSAGTDLKQQINPDAVRCMNRLYGVDMQASGQRPKLIGDIPSPDILVTMGCGVECPWLPARHREDWGLEDPTGGSDELFDEAARKIEAKVKDLRNRILAGAL